MPSSELTPRQLIKLLQELPDALQDRPLLLPHGHFPARSTLQGLDVVVPLRYLGEDEEFGGDLFDVVAAQHCWERAGIEWGEIPLDHKFVALCPNL